MNASLTASTLVGVEVTTTHRTSDLPDFTRVVPSVGASDADEILEDGLAMRAELEEIRFQASDTFVELDEFFGNLPG